MISPCEIKRIVPINYQIKSKRNDASLLIELVGVYENSENVVLNTLIIELFSCAGKQWARLLGNIKKERPMEDISKELINEIDQANSQNADNKQSYRGKRVADDIGEQSTQVTDQEKHRYRNSAV